MSSFKVDMIQALIHGTSLIAMLSMIPYEKRTLTYRVIKHQFKSTNWHDTLDREGQLSYLWLRLYKWHKRRYKQTRLHIRVDHGMSHLLVSFSHLLITANRF